MPSSRSRGFTLVEVLVALAIFVMVAVPLLSLELSSTAQTARVNLIRRAHQIAMRHLDDMLDQTEKGEAIQKDGDFEVEAKIEDVDQRAGEGVIPMQRFRVTVLYDRDPIDEVEAFRAKQQQAH